jgi:two-component system, LuxR family, response regulator FixJ
VPVGNEEAVVYVVDDDEAIRDSLRLLLRSVGLKSQVFANASDFLKSLDPARHACLLADIRMPGMSGLELQQELNERHVEIPTIFITGHGDVPMAVNAIKAGAVDFIQKPFRDQDLIDRIHEALQLDSVRSESRQEELSIRKKISTLTPREQEVMRKVVDGCANKVIALDLGVSQRTIELHRARVMHKMGVRSLADLVKVVGKIGPTMPEQVEE